jgi:hypothetical protein
MVWHAQKRSFVFYERIAALLVARLYTVFRSVEHIDTSETEWFQLPGLVQALVLFCRQNKALCCLPLRVRVPILERTPAPTPDLTNSSPL